MVSFKNFNKFLNQKDDLTFEPLLTNTVTSTKGLKILNNFHKNEPDTKEILQTLIKKTNSTKNRKPLEKLVMLNSNSNYNYNNINNK